MNTVKNGAKDVGNDVKNGMKNEENKLIKKLRMKNTP